MRKPTPPQTAYDQKPMVSALVRGMAILRAFRPHGGPLGNQELAERTGIPRATVSRMAHTLAELGYLNHDPRTERFELGGGVLTLGYAAMTNLNVVQLAEPLMRSFASDSGATVGIGTREHDHMVFLGVSLGSASVTMRAQPGTRVPIATTAMGRAYLSLLDSEDRNLLCERLKAQDPQDWRDHRAQIDTALNGIAARGFCVSMGEWQQDLNSVAAPIRTPAAIGRYVIVCGGPASRMSADSLGASFGPGIAGIADQIARAVGADAAAPDGVAGQT